jgi:hypothetical protein
MTDPTLPETRIQSGEAVAARSKTFDVLSAVDALGGPTAIGTGIGMTAKYAKDIAVAKIQANAQVRIAEITGVAPTQPGPAQQTTE